MEDIRKVYNATNLQLILPFTTFVSNSSSFSWVKSFNDGNDNKSFSVRLEGQKLEVELFNNATNQTLRGFCMDVFNPSFLSDFLEPLILRNLKEPMQGYWLQDNMPFIRNFVNELINP